MISDRLARIGASGMIDIEQARVPMSLCLGAAGNGKVRVSCVAACQPTMEHRCGHQICARKMFMMNTRTLVRARSIRCPFVLEYHCTITNSFRCLSWIQASGSRWNGEL